MLAQVIGYRDAGALQLELQKLIDEDDTGPAAGSRLRARLHGAYGGELLLPDCTANAALAHVVAGADHRDVRKGADAGPRGRRAVAHRRNEIFGVLGEGDRALNVGEELPV